MRGICGKLTSVTEISHVDVFIVQQMVLYLMSLCFQSKISKFSDTLCDTCHINWDTRKNCKQKCVWKCKDLWDPSVCVHHSICLTVSWEARVSFTHFLYTLMKLILLPGFHKNKMCLSYIVYPLNMRSSMRLYVDNQYFE